MSFCDDPDCELCNPKPKRDLLVTGGTVRELALLNALDRIDISRLAQARGVPEQQLRRVIEHAVICSSPDKQEASSVIAKLELDYTKESSRQLFKASNPALPAIKPQSKAKRVKTAQRKARKRNRK